MKPVVVLCSDDAEFCLLLQHILEGEGYAVCLTSRPEQVARLAHIPTTLAVLLDCQSISVEPQAICEALKNADLIGRVPIAALVGTGSDHHVDLIEAGIDESLVRPLAPARLLEFLRMGVTSGKTDNELGRLAPDLTLRQLEIEMSAAKHCVQCNGRVLDLGPIGFRLLQHFLAQPDQIHSRQALVTAGWPGSRRINQRNVDVHIGRLRRGLRSLCGSDVIRTVRSAGYVVQTRSHDRLIETRPLAEPRQP